MALPTSRNTTYAADSPIKSADLNDLQDTVVGMKVPLHYLHLPAAAWQARAGGGAVLGDHVWTFSGVSELVCPLVLPVGTVIASIVWSYNRGGAGTITRRGRGRNILTGAAAADWFAAVADATGAAIENVTDTPAYTTLTDLGYQLSLAVDNAAHVFYGAVVGISRL